MPYYVTLLAIVLAAGPLTVRIHGLDSDEGLVACALYDSAASFLGESSKRAERLPIRQREAVWTIEDLDPGTYAVSCYHDRNDNGALDENVLGIPTEPYGFSNDARGSFGPPKYRKARFRHDDGATTIEIGLR